MRPIDTLFSAFADLARDVSAIAACAVLLIKPIRERFFGLEAQKEGLRSLLRSEIVRLYYRHKEDKKLREYEYKNLVSCYGAYKALGGNTFIDHIDREMQEWQII